MKSVLISIQTRWVELIASGKKTLEIRKSRPNLIPPFKVYIYCSRSNSVFFWKSKTYTYVDDHSHNLFDRCGSGKVIGEYVCPKIVEFVRVGYMASGEQPRYKVICDNQSICDPKKLFDKACLSESDVEDYLKGCHGYGWRIDDLKIYDAPKEISEFYKCGTLSASDFEYSLYDGSGDPARNSYASYLLTRKVRRPPQSWCYVAETGGDASG